MPDSSHSIAMGFFSVLEIQDLGYCGGLLILNQLGRPLEFHCTMPVQPTRTQEILYGRSLRPVLFGDSIGKGLLEKARQQPDVLWVDCIDTTSVRSHASCPIGRIVVSSETENDSANDSPRPSGEDLAESDQSESSISFGDDTIDLIDADQVQRESMRNVLSRIDEDFVLAEPFSRIRQAIEEAHAVAR